MCEYLCCVASVDAPEEATHSAGGVGTSAVDGHNNKIDAAFVFSQFESCSPTNES